MKQLLAVMTVLLLAACSPAIVEEPIPQADEPVVVPEVTDDDLEGVDEIDEILDELEDLDLDLDLDEELAALDEDLQ